MSLAWVTLACVDAHWATVRWPNERPDAPRQPVLEAAELGLAVRASSIVYEPDAVVVSLSLDNSGSARLRVERAAIMLAWDELEYAAAPPDPESSEPGWIELEPGQTAALRLRYHLGRTLTSSAARLIFRSLTRDDVAVVELPELRLPAMPA